MGAVSLLVTESLHINLHRRKLAKTFIISHVAGEGYPVVRHQHAAPAPAPTPGGGAPQLPLAASKHELRLTHEQVYFNSILESIAPSILWVIPSMSGSGKPLLVRHCSVAMIFEPSEK